MIKLFEEYAEEDYMPLEQKIANGDFESIESFSDNLKAFEIALQTKNLNLLEFTIKNAINTYAFQNTLTEARKKEILKKVLDTKDEDIAQLVDAIANIEVRSTLAWVLLDNINLDYGPFLRFVVQKHGIQPHRIGVIMRVAMESQNPFKIQTYAQHLYPIIKNHTDKSLDEFIDLMEGYADLARHNFPGTPILAAELRKIDRGEKSTHDQDLVKSFDEFGMFD